AVIRGGASSLRPCGGGAADDGAGVERGGGDQQCAADAAVPPPPDDAGAAGPEAPVLELPPVANGQAPWPVSLRDVGGTSAHHGFLDAAANTPPAADARTVNLRASGMRQSPSGKNNRSLARRAQLVRRKNLSVCGLCHRTGCPQT